MNLTTAEKDRIALRLIVEGKYSVTMDGKVFSENYQGWTGERVELSQKTGAKGYRSVTLRVDGKKTYFYVHRLVALSFLGKPDDNFQINHKNGKKQDNRVENLEWVTPAENMSHARNAGLIEIPKGEQHYKATLTEQQVKEILELLQDGKITKRGIERKYGVGRGVVTAIASGKSWKHITKKGGVDDEK